MQAFARLFSLRDQPNMDVVYLEDPVVDLAVRTKLFSEARYSIDLVSFSKATDEAGAQIIQALRGAQNREVKVRSIFDQTGTEVEGDKTSDTRRLLADSKLACPGNVICASPWDKLRNGLSVDDFVHEKIVIIDAGTPYEKIIVGGRNYGKFTTDFGDAAFVLRPIDPSKPWAGSDVSAFYEHLWESLSSLFKKTPKLPAPTKALARLNSHGEMALRTAYQRKLFSEISELLDKPPQAGDELKPYQFRPSTFQMASNDLLVNASQAKSRFIMSGRAHLQNDTLDLLHTLIPGKKDITYSGYIFGLPDPIKGDFVNHVEQNGTLEVYTNGRGAFHQITPARSVSRMMGNAATDFTSRNLLPVLESGDQHQGSVKAFMLNPDPSADTSDHLPSPYKYLHRKLLIMDDTVATGSDNLTESSAMKNDEVTFVMQDSRMADYLRGQLHREAQAFYRPVTTPDIKQELKSRAWYSDCLQFMIRRAF